MGEVEDRYRALGSSLQYEMLARAVPMTGASKV